MTWLARKYPKYSVKVRAHEQRAQITPEAASGWLKHAAAQDYRLYDYVSYPWSTQSTVQKPQLSIQLVRVIMI